jgi:O-antigen ligase
LGLTGVLFLVSFALGCVLAFARHPIYGLITYIAVYYLNPWSKWWGAGLPALRWSLLAAIITLVALLVRRDKKQPAIPLFSHSVMIGLLVFLLWIVVQSFWVLDWSLHLELLGLMAKYVVLVAVIYKCIETETHLRMFLWTHVLGCVYLGWVVYTTYEGGRFEDFGPPDLNEANSGALQIVTGILVASSLFLIGSVRAKLALFAGMPLLVNALVATISRSGFLEIGFGGLLFNLFTTSRFRLRVWLLSVLAVVLFVMLTNPVYWTRISSIQEAGQDVEGVDTGLGRLDIIKAQFLMFRDHPLGCGHRCTATLSGQFLSDEKLTGEGENRARSSHNTYMTMLVEHGIPGLLLYLMLTLWLFKSVRSLIRSHDHREGVLPTLVPAIAGVTGALIVGDLFVDYLIIECRIWLIGLVMVMLNLTKASARAAVQTGAPARSPTPLAGVAVPRPTQGSRAARDGRGRREGSV